MIILDILEGVHRIIMLCKHRSIRMHVYMHVCMYVAREQMCLSGVLLV